MNRLLLSRKARKDIKNIMRRTEVEFGPVVRNRYRKLIDASLKDLMEEPTRHGVKNIDDVEPGYKIYHLARSKNSVDGERIKKPRHLIVFNINEDELGIVAVVHEREIIERHLRE